MWITSQCRSRTCPIHSGVVKRSKDDFKRAALEKTDTIDVLSFVPATAIDARYFETPYYVAPGKGADRAYVLLRETIRKTGKVGVAQLILRQSQHLAALSVKDDVFVLTLLRIADDPVVSLYTKYK